MLKKIGLALALLLPFSLVPQASAARFDASISVTDGVWQGYSTATVVAPEPPKNSTPNYVGVRCWGYDGTLIWGAWFDIVDGTSTIGPFWAYTTWSEPVSADCLATVSYFARSGFGRQVDMAETAFSVYADEQVSLLASSQNNTPSVSLVGPKEAAPAFGQNVTFDASWQNVPGWAWPMFYVGCFQDKNDDGTIDTSGTWNDEGVYGELRGPDGYAYADMAPRTGSSTVTFQLGGGSSDWHLSPGPALCYAQAYTYSRRSGWQQVIPYGDRVYFWASDPRTAE